MGESEQAWRTKWPQSSTAAGGTSRATTGSWNALGTGGFVEVSRYERYRDGSTKITEVAVEAHLVNPSTGRTLGEVHCDACVRGRRGRAFDQATRMAIGGLAATIDSEAVDMIREGGHPGRI